MFTEWDGTVLQLWMKVMEYPSPLFFLLLLQRSLKSLEFLEVELNPFAKDLTPKIRDSVFDMLPQLVAVDGTNRCVCML